MSRCGLLSLAVAGLLGLSATVIAAAQEKHTVSFKIPPENSKYTQQLFIDVGDAPGHQVRVFELRRSFPSDRPEINGIRLVEMWARGTSDYSDGNGPGAGYIVSVMENGDKFFTRYSLVAQYAGSGKSNATVTGSITGGTGKLAGIRGVYRQTATLDPKASFIDTQTEIEYWIEK